MGAAFSALLGDRTLPAQREGQGSPVYMERGQEREGIKAILDLGFEYQRTVISTELRGPGRKAGSAALLLDEPGFR